MKTKTDTNTLHGAAKPDGVSLIDPAPLHRLGRRVLACALALGAAILLPIVPPSAHAAVAEAWVHRYFNVVSNATDVATKVVRDSAGDIIVTGISARDSIVGSQFRADMITIKISGADGSIVWEQRFNGPANSDDYPVALAVDGRGNVVVTTHIRESSGTFEASTVKYAAADGALLWVQHHEIDAQPAMALDGSGDVVVTGYKSGGGYTAKFAAANGALLWEASSPAYSLALAVDGAGNVAVTGFSSNGTNHDYYTTKYAAATGALLWERRYNGPANNHDEPSAIAVDGGGNVVVTGFSSNGGIRDYYTAKYAAATGVRLWERRYNGPANLDDAARAVAVDGGDNVVVTGYSSGTNSLDYYTAKYAAATGALLWETRYNRLGYDDGPNAIAVDGGGNVVVAGSSGRDSDTDCYTAKYAAADGALLWENRYNGPANGYDAAAGVVVAGDGSVVVAATSDGGATRYDYYAAKYTATGAPLWEQRYSTPRHNDHKAQAVAVDPNGNVVVTGYSFGLGTGRDFYTAKYAMANGALLWEQRYNGPANLNDEASAVALDGDQNVIVTGYSYGLGSGRDFYTAKYAAADGAMLWERRFNGPMNLDDVAVSVAVDDNGDVIVMGSTAAVWYAAKYAAADGVLLWERGCSSSEHISCGYAWAGTVDSSGNAIVSGTVSNDFYLVKLATATGELLWERRYAIPTSRMNSVAAITVDGDDNVILTGDSVGPTSFDYYTAKCAAANGALLWEKRYNGPASLGDYATAVAVDGNGNVAVTGYSFTALPNSRADYYTAKYAAADGALVWEKRSNNGFGLAGAVAVDGNGNVVVTGRSSQPSLGGGSDYYTAKYAGPSGELLWEQRYNGTDNTNDYVEGPRSLALGPGGMVVVAGYAEGQPCNTPNFIGCGYDYATVVYRETPAPLVLVQPADLVVAAGANALFTVMAINGADAADLPISYRWFFNQTTAVGVSSPTLLLTNVGVAQLGGYSVVVSNAFGSVTSRVANLDFAVPRILVQPADLAVLPGSNALFTVVATNAGTLPMNYRWYFNQTTPVGISSPTLLITNVGPTQLGGYWVEVSNVIGSVTSRVATLDYAVPPVIVMAPQSRTNIAGDDVTFTVTVTNNATLPIGYQWRKGAAFTNIVLNSRSCTLTLFNVSINSSTNSGPGNYRVVVTNAGNQVPGLSAVATLTVLPAAAPTAQTLAASNLVSTGAKLHASVNPMGAQTVAWFDYGVTAAYGSRTVATNIGNAAGPVAFAQSVGGLLPDTNYHYRVVATNYGGMALGADLVFQTTASVAPPIISAYELLGNGQFRLRFTSTPGAGFSVHVSTNLGDWNPLGPAVERTPGQFEFTDAAAPSPRTRFYRLRSP